MDPHGDDDSGLCMRPEFMDRFHALRMLVGWPIIVHFNGGYSTQGHATDSAHYLGLAADFHCHGVTSNRLSECIRKINFNGVGAYEHWTPIMGFHVDMRQRRARWIKTYSGKYISLT